DLYVVEALGGSEDVAPNPPETVDPDLDGHSLPPLRDASEVTFPGAQKDWSRPQRQDVDAGHRRVRERGKSTRPASAATATSRRSRALTADLLRLSRTASW